MHEAHGIQTTAELLVPPHKFAEFGEFIENFNLKTTILTENFQE